MLLVKSPIKYNHNLFQVNDVIEEIDEKDAKALIDAGAAVEVKSKSEAKRVSALSEKSPETTDETTEENEDPFEGLTPHANWSKTRLLGFARAKGLEVDDTLTRAEIMEVINAGATDEEAEEVEDEPADEAASIGGNQPPVATSTATPEK